MKNPVRFSSRSALRSSNNTIPQLSNYPTIQLSNYLPGQIFILILIFFVVAMILATSLFSRVSIFVRSGASGVQHEQAVAIAEAGVEKAVYDINNGGTGAIGETQLGTSGKFKTSVALVGSDKKITSTGCIPDCTKIKRTVKVTVTEEPITVAFPYTVQADTGGIKFTDSLNTNTIAGKAYSNYNITCAGSTSLCKINGDAHMNAPSPVPIPVTPVNPPSTYQREVGASPQPMPAIIENDWIKAASCNNNPLCIQNCPGTPPTCTFGSTNLKPGTDTSPGNHCCQFNGNLRFIVGGTIKIQGPVYVKSVSGANPAPGSLTLSGTVGITPQTLTSCGAGFLADGPIIIDSGVTVSGSLDNPPGYILFESTYSTNPVITLGLGVPAKNGIYYAKNGSLSIARLTGFATTQGVFVGKTVSLSGPGLALASGPGLENPQFCSVSNKWIIKRGTYKISL